MTSAVNLRGERRAAGSTLPRCLNRREAAAYCGCESLPAFDGWVRRGIVPGAMRGTRRWDRKAIDAALDRLSGLERELPPIDQRELAERAFDEWVAGNAG